MKFSYSDTAQITTEQITKEVEKISDYIAHLNEVAKTNNYEADEASINLPFDDSLAEQISTLSKEKKTKTLKYLVVIGIGGSNLGTKAIYDSFYGFYDVLESGRYPKVIFLDTQDESILLKTIELIKKLQSKDEILVNVISKSGGTTETSANLEVVYKSLTQKFGDINDRIVMTTDEGSQMHQVAQKKQISVLTIPKKVGGRFSIFSAVGLFPLSILGFNIEELRKGAKTMRNKSLQTDIKENSALISAVIMYLHSTHNKRINDNFIFLPQLESLGKWYRQLMGESLGKDGKGITPIVSIGSTDLHSVGQLYLGGTKDKITTFIYSKNPLQKINVPENTVFNLVPIISGKSIHSIMNAIVEGTKIAYQKQDLPFTEIVFDSFSEYSIASFIQFKMMEMIYLGKLMEVNTFDQPHVELYKTETKRLLEEL